MKKICYNKLVRDKIPEKIKESGGKFEIRRLTAKEYGRELLRKVAEEASGIAAAKTRKELVDEVGDVLDVIDEIKKLKKISEPEMRTARGRALKIKGGFKKRLFLYWTSDTGYRSNEKKNK